MWCVSLRRAGAAGLWALILSHAAVAAEPLGLSEAQSIALARSQQIAAGNASITAARELASAAGRLPDPVLRLGIDNLPINGPDRLSLSRDFMTMRRIGLAQELPSADKRQLRSERAQQDTERAHAQRQAALAGVERDTALAWVERYYAERLRELVLRQLEEAATQVQLVQSGYGTGRSSQSDVLAARAAAAALEDRLIQANRQEKNAVWTLTRWVGADGSRALAGAPPWQESRLDYGTLEEHLAWHPDLLTMKLQAETAITEARLARANTRPDWSVEAMYSQRGAAFSNMLSIGVSVPLQWDRVNRQDREVAARLAQVEEARARYEELRRHHELELRNQMNDWQAAKARVARYRDDLLPLARQRTEAALTAYRSAKGDLAAVLTARRDEIDMRVQALSVELEAARAWAQINFLMPDHVPSGARQEKP